MNKTFQSFVFGCRVNEAERIKLDTELAQAGYTVDLASPGYLIINTCAITGKAEREAKQFIHQLKKKYPEAKIVVTGCSATVWEKYQTPENKLADILVPNDKKSSLVALLATDPLSTWQVDMAQVAMAGGDKFRASNRLLVKIQDGCQRFCCYCIVPYLRGLPQSQSIDSLVSYINSFTPTPSEVVLSAINTEAFGLDSKERFVDLILEVLAQTKVPRLAFGSIHPWSLTTEFLNYYAQDLSKNTRFVNFFHVPIQSGSQTILKAMKREYQIGDVISALKKIQTIQPNALIATDVIVGFLGETNELFEETFKVLEQSPISRFHVFRFSNRPHTAAYYLRSQLKEPTAEEKRNRSKRLIELSQKKYVAFLETQIGIEKDALVIAPQKGGMRVLLDNHVEGHLPGKQYLPGQIVHVTIRAAKDSVAICRES